MSADVENKAMLSGKAAFWISLLIMAMVAGPSMKKIPYREAPPLEVQLALLGIFLNTALALMSIRTKKLSAFATRFFLLVLSSFIGVIIGFVYALATHAVSFKVGG
jgi:hypothetical protein